MKLNSVIISAVACMVAIAVSNVGFAADAATGLPNAKVSKLPALTLAADSYMAWPSGPSDVDRPLQIVMNFKANETAEEARPKGFLPWKCDFYLTFTGIKDGTLTADNCYLAGNYGTFGWIVIPADGMPIENGVEYPVVSGYDANITYKQICESVKDFTAAIYVAPEILEANPDFKVKLALKMTNPDDANDVITIGEPAIYDVAALKPNVSVSVPDAGKVTVNGSDDATGVARTAIEQIVKEFSANAAVAAVRTGINAADNADEVAAAKAELVKMGVPETSANGVTPVVAVALSGIVTNESEAISRMVFDVTPSVSAAGKSVKISEFSSEVKFRLPVFSGEDKTFAKVYHNDDLMNVYKVLGEGTQKYIEIASKNFSLFAVEPYAYPVMIGENGYETLSAAVAAAVSNDTVKVMCDIALAATLEIPAAKEDLTIDLNGFTVSGAEDVKVINNGELKIRDSSKEMTGKLSVPFSNSGKAWLAGGRFIRGFVNTGSIQISGGAYPESVDRGLITAGYACSKIGEGNEVVYVVAKLPTATVTPVPDSELSAPLTFALKFKANNVSDNQLACFGDWYADFVLTVNKQVVFNANDTDSSNGYLSGQYDAWSESWMNVPFKDVTLTADNPLKIMEYAAELMGESGLKLTYNDICSFVKEFNCGVFFKPEFLAANSDLKVSLSLKMFNPENENESYAIGIEYEFMPPAETDTVTVRDQNGLIVNCETMKDAIAAVIEKGDAVDGGEVAIIKDFVISEDLTVSGTRNLFFDLGAKKTLTLETGKQFVLSNVNVAFIGAGALSGFTADNVKLEGASVLTLPATERALALEFEDAGKYVTDNDDGTWSVANKFELQIQMTDDGLPAIGFLKDARRSYTVESSTDLVSWTTVEASETTGDSEVAVPLKWQAPQSGTFFRVRATDPGQVQ